MTVVICNLELHHQKCIKADFHRSFTSHTKRGLVGDLVEKYFLCDPYITLSYKFSSGTTYSLTFTTPKLVK